MLDQLQSDSWVLVCQGEPDRLSGFWRDSKTDKVHEDSNVQAVRLDDTVSPFVQAIKLCQEAKEIAVLLLIDGKAWEVRQDGTSQKMLGSWTRIESPAHVDFLMGWTTDNETGDIFSVI